MSDYPPPPPQEEPGSTPPPPPPPGGGYSNPPGGGYSPPPGYTPPPPPPGGGYTPPPPPPGGGYPGYTQYPGGGGGAPQSNQKALWSMIIGIASIPLGCFACLGWVGIAAVILGNTAKKEIASSGGWQTGEGQAKAGVTCGIIGAVFGTLILVVNLALLANGTDVNF